VPWSERQHASDVLAELKLRGNWVLVAEQTAVSVRPEQLVPMFPATFALGGDRRGVSPELLAPSQFPCSEWKFPQCRDRCRRSALLALCAV